MQNNVNPTVTAAQITAINTAVAAINTNLVGMINLSDEQKLHGSKMGPDTYDYCVKNLLFMVQNATLVPAWVNQPNIQSNMDTFNALRAIILSLNSIFAKVADTMTQMGIQIKKASDDFYENVKDASERGSVPGANAIVDELKVFYQKSQAEQTPTP